MIHDILVVGAGGHARVIISLIKQSKRYNLVGIADRDNKFIGEKINNEEIKYSWDDFLKLYNHGLRKVAIAIGNNKERKKIYKKLTSIGFSVETMIDSSAIIDKSATIKNGVCVCLGVKIGANAHIKENSIIYTGSIIDHETILGEHSFIAPGVSVAGRVNIGDNCFIGIGSTIIDKITIEDNVIIGAGSVVLEDVKSNTTVVGIPAKPIL